MPLSTINFFTEDISYTLKHKTAIRKWINDAITNNKLKVGEISFIFCSDEYLHKINVEYLNHDTYTDIITFDTSENDDTIAGDIFISIERIKENAIKFNTAIADEVHRVIIHGILHLCGYLDKTKKDKELMTAKENEYLSKRNF